MRHNTSTLDIVIWRTHKQVVSHQEDAGNVAQQRDTEAHTQRRTQWVMGSQTQQRVTQPKGFSLTLIVCRKESALVFITSVVSGEGTPTAASVGLLASISSSCHHSSRRACTRLPLTQHLSHVPFFSPVTFFLPCRQSVSRLVICNVSQSDKLWFAVVHVNVRADMTN